MLRIGAKSVARFFLKKEYNEECVKNLIAIFADLKTAKNNAESFEKLEKLGVSE